MKRFKKSNVARTVVFYMLIVVTFVTTFNLINKAPETSVGIAIAGAMWAMVIVMIIWAIINGIITETKEMIQKKNVSKK